MRRIEGDEFTAIMPYFEQAAQVAADATCFRAKCGSIIVKGNKVIGRGFNAPPLDDEGQRLCEAKMDVSTKPKYDKTCCVHAEWRAILNASQAHGTKIAGSTLYFMRVDENGEFTDAGDPFCTVCSRLAVEAGIKDFALYNEQGADIYPTGEYNLASYRDYVT